MFDHYGDIVLDISDTMCYSCSLSRCATTITTMSCCYIPGHQPCEATVKDYNCKEVLKCVSKQ